MDDMTVSSSMVVENCENCKYCRQLNLYRRKVKTVPENSHIVSGFRINTDISHYEYSFCCTYFMDDEEAYRVVVETSQHDTCENFKSMVE